MKLCLDQIFKVKWSGPTKHDPLRKDLFAWYCMCIYAYVDTYKYLYIYYIILYTYIHVLTYLYIAASLKHSAKAQSLPPGNQAWRPHHDVDAGSDHCNFPKPRQKTNTLNKLVLLEAVPFICKLFFFWNLGSRKSLESYHPLGRRVSVDHGLRPGIFMIFPATLISGHPWGGISSPFPIFTGTIFGEILRNGFTASKKKWQK